MSPSDARPVCSAERAGWFTTPLRRLITDSRWLLKGLAGLGDVVADLGCGPGHFTLPLAEVDFALAFWMVHGVPDVAHFMAEVCAMLRPAGHLFVVEPKGYVDEAAWSRTVAAAEAAGMAAVERRKVAFSRAALFERLAA